MDPRPATHSAAYYQHTLFDALTFVGHGLHSNDQVTMRIVPAEPNSGIVFSRRDIDAARSDVPALWHHAVYTRLSTTLGNNQGIRIHTVELLLAALYACGIDNARIFLDSPEVPIMDGSALPYMARIQKAGVFRQSELRRAILIKKAVSVTDGNRCAAFTPSSTPWIDIEIDYESPAIGKQRISLPVNQKTFQNEMASARIFGFDEQVETLQALGFAKGASLQNAILIKQGKVVNKGGLRYPDEFVRHKAIDCLGDMALAGARIVGCFKGRRTGHQINHDLLRELMLRHDCWEYTTLMAAEEYWKKRHEAPSSSSDCTAAGLSGNNCLGTSS